MLAFEKGAMLHQERGQAVDDGAHRRFAASLIVQRQPLLAPKFRLRIADEAR